MNSRNKLTFGKFDHFLNTNNIRLKKNFEFIRFVIIFIIFSYLFVTCQIRAFGNFFDKTLIILNENDQEWSNNFKEVRLNH